MESPEEDKRPEPPAARPGGWGGAPRLSSNVAFGEACFSSFRLLRLRLSESCADIPVRLLVSFPHKKKTTAVAIVLRSG